MTRVEIQMQPASLPCALRWVGGRYVYGWTTPDGELSARGEYLEPEPGRLLVQTWESWGPERRMADGDAVLKVEFSDCGGGTTEMTQP